MERSISGNRLHVEGVRTIFPSSRDITDVHLSNSIVVVAGIDGPPNGLRISRRRRRAAYKSAKIATILRAEGGRTACAGWAARR
jgi:hypothetical protein